MQPRKVSLQFLSLCCAANSWILLNTHLIRNTFNPKNKVHIGYHLAQYYYIDITHLLNLFALISLSIFIVYDLVYKKSQNSTDGVQLKIFQLFLLNAAIDFANLAIGRYL